MEAERVTVDQGIDETVQITRHHPAEPRDGETVVAATVAVGEQLFPMTLAAADGGWAVAFGALADEGRYATFAEALRVAHERIARDAAELARSLRDGGY